MKIAILELSPELFVEFAKACKKGPPRRFTVKANALPDDASIVRVGFTGDSQGLYTLKLVVQSETFADVPNGEMIPELPAVVFETVNDECAKVAA